ncbi:Cation/H(+) antiporter 15 [Linum perenne]
MNVSHPTWKYETICVPFPSQVSAKGLSYRDVSIIDQLLAASLSLLNIQILLIFVTSNSLNFLLRRFRIPLIVSQSLTGVILGPTLLGRTDFFRHKLFPHESQDLLEIIGFIGYATLLFLVGVKMDIATMINSGKKAWTIGLTSLIFPLFLGLASQSTKIRGTRNEQVVEEILTVTEVQCLTSFAVVSELLDELKLTNSEIGRLALSSSVITGTYTCY